jgi:asparagine synthase (glutamine-hydrolysing)
MRDAGESEIRAITLAFDEFKDLAEDEAPLAAHVAERYGARHVIRKVSKGEFQNDLPDILEAMDQPSIDGVNAWFVSKAAKEVGLKVALSGLGGDELLAGYPSFVEVPRWRRWFGPFAGVPGVGLLARLAIRAMAPDLARARPKAAAVFDYANSWAGAYLLRRGLHLPHELSQILDPDFAREGLRRLKPLRRLTAILVPDPGSDVARVCALESAHYMRNQLLRDADWAGMAHSVEIRVPLVDSMLLESLAPIIWRLAPGAGKAALASAPLVPLPYEIVNRVKTGFTVPTRAWMDALSGATSTPGGNRQNAAGLISRRWSRMVLGDEPIKPHQVRPA